MAPLSISRVSVSRTARAPLRQGGQVGETRTTTLGIWLWALKSLRNGSMESLSDFVACISL